MNVLKKTPLHDWHVANGAKMGPFGDWEMPLRYSGEMKEHRAVREIAGLFDISHMGVIVVNGADTEKFAQYVTTNDASRLGLGDIQYTLICNKNGMILDDVTLYREARERFFLVVNASNVEKIKRWFHAMINEQHFSGTITVIKDIAILALQGPRAEEILTDVLPHSLLPNKRYSFTRAILYGCPVIISRTGYTGEDGFEIICRNKLSKILWKQLFDASKNLALEPLPCGLVARDMLRTEAGMRLYGNDIDETINPIEAGLERYISLKKDFIGKGAIEKALALRNRGGGRFFTGFVMDKKFSPEHGSFIFVGAEVGIPDNFGIVTSATYSPSFKKRILMGYIREKKNPGETVWVKIGEDYRPAIVTALPFYSRKK